MPSLSVVFKNHDILGFGGESRLSLVYFVYWNDKTVAWGQYRGYIGDTSLKQRKYI